MDTDYSYHALLFNKEVDSDKAFDSFYFKELEDAKKFTNLYTRSSSYAWNQMFVTGDTFLPGDTDSPIVEEYDNIPEDDEPSLKLVIVRVKHNYYDI